MNSTRKLLSDFATQTVGLLSGRPVADDGVSEPAPLVPGYLVRRLIGRGGFGEVYLVRSIEGEELALKVLPAGADDPIRQVKNEADAGAVQHPNVVSVKKHGLVGDRPYLITEYCPGGSLAARLESQPGNPQWVAEILYQLALGLSAIHTHYVHNDLSSNNVLFDAAGTPRIADFGLAKPIAAVSRTIPIGAAGTPGYRAQSGFAELTRIVGRTSTALARSAIAPSPGNSHTVRSIKGRTRRPSPCANSCRRCRMDWPPSFTAV